ncbi:protein phosphatase 2C domain-containing protein [Polynucleobacter paneuropaeus]|nr:protein phosphatase 2C domain-containing protein [Polynucleobacter paneuropaeus]
MTWTIGAAKTVGKSHLTSGAPCQDSVDYKLTDSGKCFILALSDGAGSSSKSQVGSDLFTRRICSTLEEAFNRLGQITDSDLDKIVIEIIQAVRDELHELGDIKDFHATSLIAIGNAKSVRVYHIGDGAALVAERQSKDNFLLHRSEPENGEFANETFFFTLEEWQKKLRIFSVKNPAFCILCSDGVDPFIWDSSTGTRQGFIRPIIIKLLEGGNSSNANDVLKKVIEDPRTDSVTTDDKSIAVAIRKDLALTKFDKWTFSDKVKPTSINYEEVKKEVAAAIQATSIKIPNHQTVESEGSGCTSSARYRSLFGRTILVSSILFLIVSLVSSLGFLYANEDISLREINTSLIKNINSFEDLVSSKIEKLFSAVKKSTSIPEAKKETKIIIIEIPSPSVDSAKSEGPPLPAPSEARGSKKPLLPESKIDKKNTTDHRLKEADDD